MADTEWESLVVRREQPGSEAEGPVQRLRTPASKRQKGAEGPQRRFRRTER